ncbi:MAG: PQQ-like beta-propeller repeat protein [Gemmataceae bacterium]|nr:PQQ-like beta-propeller repeat protein [Gemmataceae bacterium]
MTAEPEPRIRLWPGLALVGAAVFCYLTLPLVEPRSKIHFIGGLGGPVMCSLGILGWWLFASRVTGTYRWLPVLLFVGPAFANIALFYREAPLTVMLFGFPFAALLWVLWLAVSRPASRFIQLAGLLGVIAGAWTLFSMVRIGETDANIRPELAWRWEPTKLDTFKEERAKQGLAKVDGAAVAVQPGDWAEFRGPKRDNIVRGISIDTDWEKSPPKLLWKHRVGPGWGSFAVVGDRLFTQEQVDENQEAVVCYLAKTGERVWEHKYTARFYEQIAGVGPRGTPTVVDGRVYTFGGSGILCCLDAVTGKPHWTRNVPADTGAVPQQWGYSSSPLVHKGLVVVFANGPDGKGTAAYRADTGEPAWTAGKGTFGYSSAQVATFDGVEQILIFNDIGVESHDPASGTILWTFDWFTKGVNRVSQPAIVSDTDFVVGTGVGGDQGLRRVRVTRSGKDWKTETVWKTRNLKPYFNDGVVHDGHYYGFDDAAFACIDLKDGARKWKTGQQYGHGQVVLLADQGLLLVQAVDGKVVLVRATPDEHDEIAKFPALAGKTWNHPVVAHGRLFVRNGIEAAAYELTTR